MYHGSSRRMNILWQRSEAPCVAVRCTPIGGQGSITYLAARENKAALTTSIGLGGVHTVELCVKDAKGAELYDCNGIISLFIAG